MMLRRLSHSTSAGPFAYPQSLRRLCHGTLSVGVTALLLTTLPVWAVEPDDSGIGGTGRGDETKDGITFDRPELPERIERVETPQTPEFSRGPELPRPPSDVATPPNDIVPANPTPGVPASGPR